MSKNADIIKALRQITDDPNGVGSTVICTVLEVDMTLLTCYCSPLDPTLPDFIDCRLMTDPESGFLIIPSINSQVTVMNMGLGDSQVIQYSSVYSIQLNGKNYGGLVIIADLVDKLNNLEKAFNKLVGDYNIHTHGGITTGTSVTLTPIPIDTDTLTLTVIPDLENTTVLMGSGI